MTKGHKDILRKIVRESAFEAAVQEICEGLPVASGQELLDGKYSTEELAIRHAFTAGALHSLTELNRLGQAPKSKKTHTQAKHFRIEQP
jgi:hypothetical protein